MTYTHENQRQICQKLAEANEGIPPDHIHVLGWYTFLINELIRPYQASLTDEVGWLRGLNFIGKHHKFAKKTDLHYFVDSNDDLFRDGVSEFAALVNEASDGLVITRLTACYPHIFIDEFQDLVGFDLEVLDLLLQSNIALTLVGDPRQHTYATSNTMKNKKYVGAGFIDWLNERADTCDIATLTASHRCSQEICDFADALFPDLPATTSLNNAGLDHRGVFVISRHEIADYIRAWNPTILRDSKRSKTEGLRAINIGVSKGSTFDRVLIFGTKPMLNYVATLDPQKAGDKTRLYVAVTRARHSATFVN